MHINFVLYYWLFSINYADFILPFHQRKKWNVSHVLEKNTYMSNLENNYHYVVFHSAMLQIITEITMLTLLIFPSNL